MLSVIRSISPVAFALLVAGLLHSSQALACNTLAWSSQSGTAISASDAAAFAGQCGVRFTLGEGAPSWVADQSPGTLSPVVSQYAARFYLYQNDASLPSGTALTLMQALDASQTELFALELVGGSATGLRIRVRNGAGTTSSGQIELPSGWRALETRWQSGSGNGSLVLALDGQDRLSLSSLDNGGLAVDSTRLGLVGGASVAQSGWLDVDSFASRRTSTNGLIEKPCSGTAVDITNTTFLPGSHNCVGTTSLTVGERVQVDAGANLSLVAPLVVLAPGSAISNGAVLSVNQP